MPVTKVIYSSLDYDKDVKRFEETENGKSRLDLAGFKRLMIHDLCTNTDVLKSHKIKGYSLDRISDALENPTSNPMMLIEISHYLMYTSQFYMRLNNYFGKMGLFNYNIDVYDIRESELDSEEKQMKLRDAYANVCSEFEKMGFKHEMSKIMSVLPMQDVFYGLIFEDSSDFFILSINPSICKIMLNKHIWIIEMEILILMGGLFHQQISRCVLSLMKTLLLRCHFCLGLLRIFWI